MKLDDEDDGDEYNDKIDFFKSFRPFLFKLLRLPPVDCCDWDGKLGSCVLTDCGDTSFGSGGCDLLVDDWVKEPNSSSNKLAEVLS